MRKKRIFKKLSRYCCPYCKSRNVVIYHGLYPEFCYCDDCGRSRLNPRGKTVTSP
jgi:hypothetical protein